MRRADQVWWAPLVGPGLWGGGHGRGGLQALAARPAVGQEHGEGLGARNSGQPQNCGLGGFLTGHRWALVNLSRFYWVLAGLSERKRVLKDLGRS